MEMLQTLKAVGQISSSEVANTAHLPHADQLSTRALETNLYMHQVWLFLHVAEAEKGWG